MDDANAQAPRPSGLKTALDTIVSPKEAFESIRVAPTWGWAIVIAVSCICGTILLCWLAFFFLLWLDKDGRL